MANSRLDERVVRAAEAALAEQGYVSAIDVLGGLGWLTASHVRLDHLVFLPAGRSVQGDRTTAGPPPGPC